MVNERLVINTGPLILLSKAEALDVIGSLPYDFICPQAVQNELNIGILKGYPAVAPSWLTVQSIAEPISPFSAIALDAGESEVIQLALELKIRIVCLDELKGRRVARALGLKVTGALGLLGRAKKIGAISALRPYIKKLLVAGAWYSQELLDDFIAEFGE
jgi:predicted nucleic acid-binding protein